jgi:hypothetical protein
MNFQVLVCIVIYKACYVAVYGYYHVRRSWDDNLGGFICDQNWPLGVLFFMYINLV